MLKKAIHGDLQATAAISQYHPLTLHRYFFRLVDTAKNNNELQRNDKLFLKARNRAVALMRDMGFRERIAQSNCTRGISRAAGTVDLINNAIFNCDDDLVGTFNSIVYCATDDDHSGDSATNVQISQSADDWAALVTDAAGNDFSVTDVSSESLIFKN